MSNHDQFTRVFRALGSLLLFTWIQHFYTRLLLLPLQRSEVSFFTHCEPIFIFVYVVLTQFFQLRRLIVLYLEL